MTDHKMTNRLPDPAQIRPLLFVIPPYVSGWYHEYVHNFGTVSSSLLIFDPLLFKQIEELPAKQNWAARQNNPHPHELDTFRHRCGGSCSVDPRAIVT
jgi:hypothetical protein